jgi:hypothetical protein
VTIEELHRVLVSVGLEPTPEDLADVLWLAMRIPASRSGKPRPRPAARRAGAGRSVMPPDKQPRPGTDSKRDGLDLRLAGLTQGPARVRVAAGPALHPALPLTRGLRPLRRLRIPGTATQFDDQATADFAAEQRLWIPVLRPVSEPVFDLAVLHAIA